MPQLSSENTKSKATAKKTFKKKAKGKKITVKRLAAAVKKLQKEAAPMYRMLFVGTEVLQGGVWNPNLCQDLSVPLLLTCMQSGIGSVSRYGQCEGNKARLKYLEVKIMFTPRNVNDSLGMNNLWTGGCYDPVRVIVVQWNTQSTPNLLQPSAMFNALFGYDQRIDNQYTNGLTAMYDHDTGRSKGKQHRILFDQVYQLTDEAPTVPYQFNTIPEQLPEGASQSVYFNLLPNVYKDIHLDLTGETVEVDGNTFDGFNTTFDRGALYLYMFTARNSGYVAQSTSTWASVNCRLGYTCD